jgi:hypothetical protein
MGKKNENEIKKLKRARQLGLRLEDMLKERLYRTGTRLHELQQERIKIEERIIKLEDVPRHKTKHTKNTKETSKPMFTQ